MKLVADVMIDLPFKLDFCAKGPDVDPLTCELDGFQSLLYFPPSMGDGTDGMGIFGEWAWWTGRSLRLVMERDLSEFGGDEDALRRQTLAAGNEILRRFLNACRWRLGRADVHPVRLDPRTVTLELLHDDGRREALAEPVASFFYQTMPSQPPLETSVNAQTLATLAADVQTGQAPPLAAQLRLDADFLELQGEVERAEMARGLIEN